MKKKKSQSKGRVVVSKMKFGKAIISVTEIRRKPGAITEACGT